MAKIVLTTKTFGQDHSSYASSNTKKKIIAQRAKVIRTNIPAIIASAIIIF
jgi:hypothetical protein